MATKYNKPEPTKKPPHLLWWSVGCFTLNFAVNETVNKYGAMWSGAVIIALWLAALIPFAIWALLHERSLLSRTWIFAKFREHPVSTTVIILLFLWVAFSQTSRIVSRFGNEKQTPTIAEKGLQQQPATPSAPTPKTQSRPDTTKSPGGTSQSAPATAPPAAHKAPPSVIPTQQLPAPAPTQPTSPNPPNSGPNCPNNSGFCTGTNNGTQQQFFGAPHPVPMAYFSLKSLPSGTQPNDPESQFEGMYVGSPGGELAIRTDGDFQSPTFRIVCDGGCLPTFATLYTRHGSSVSGTGIDYRTAPDPSEPKGFFIKFTVPSGTLEQGQTIVLRLRTGGLTDPVKVASVTSVTQ